jgi:hypothetical protein
MYLYKEYVLTLNIMYSLEYLINHVSNSIKNAYLNTSKLSQEILTMEGMSGDKTRHLYNNICDLSGVHYLEVGTWKGSSFISALYKNNIYGTSIDNWSQFEGPSNEFYSNIIYFLKKNFCNLNIIDKDSWNVTYKDIEKPIHIFMYDGAHTYEDQKKAITYYHNFFSKYVIIMVDDWTCDWVDVRKGTLDGIKEMNLKIHYQNEIGLVNTNNHHTGGNTFWNGCGVFVCERIDI